MTKRLLFAVDENGTYLRETLCVIRHYESGEVEYHTKPILDGDENHYWMPVAELIRELYDKQEVDDE